MAARASHVDVFADFGRHRRRSAPQRLGGCIVDGRFGHTRHRAYGGAAGRVSASRNATVASGSCSRFRAGLKDGAQAARGLRHRSDGEVHRERAATTAAIVGEDGTGYAARRNERSRRCHSGRHGATGHGESARSESDTEFTAGRIAAGE